jgi:hypothetical protein
VKDACGGKAGREGGREEGGPAGVEGVGGDKGAGVEVEGEEGGIGGEEDLDGLGGDAPAVPEGEAFKLVAVHGQGKDATVGDGGTEA